MSKDTSCSRTQSWMGKATTLMVWASGTVTYLAYQADVLDAVLDGFEASGWKRPEVADLEAKGPPEETPAKEG